MRETHIDSLAHLMKEALEKPQNKPIIFLGAGMSVTGGIPLADKIAKDILSEYGNNPDIKRLKKSDQTYAQLMACLTTNERNTLLNNYIENAKVNVGYIYLANLIKRGYVDYVLTVNFDNLLLRAMAMYNMFPPQYDLPILSKMTTSNIEKQSVTYLHGTYKGLRMLNTQEEMDMIHDTCPNFFNRIIENRTWIVVGYSGEDPILKHIADLTTFTNNLYWVTYRDNDPIDRVKTELLDKPNTNAYALKGYDADSFFIRLHAELGLETPEILDNPFTSLLNTMESIVEYEEIKSRLEINKRMIKDAIKRYEEGITPKGYTGKKKEVDLLIKEVIKYTSEGAFEENANRIEEIRQEAKLLNNKTLNEKLSILYYIWSFSIDKDDPSSLDTAFKAPNTDNYLIALIYDKIKDIPNTLKYLEIAIKEAPRNLMELKSPIWKHLHDNPDFIALIEKYEKIEAEKNGTKK